MQYICEVNALFTLSFFYQVNALIISLITDYFIILCIETGGGAREQPVIAHSNGGRDYRRMAYPSSLESFRCAPEILSLEKKAVPIRPSVAPSHFSSIHNIPNCVGIGIAPSVCSSFRVSPSSESRRDRVFTFERHFLAVGGNSPSLSGLRSRLQCPLHQQQRHLDATTTCSIISGSSQSDGGVAGRRQNTSSDSQSCLPANSSPRPGASI